VARRQASHFVVVDALVFLFHSVATNLYIRPAEIQRMPVCQVAAVREIHSENDVVLLQGGHIDGHVGGCAGMRLNVGMIRAEELFGTIDG